MPPSTPESLSTRYFPCTPVSLKKAIEHPEQLPLVDEVVNSITSGFNRCLVTYGERGSGKTKLLFGATAGQPCLVAAILHRTYETLASSDAREYSVALSAWVVRGNRVVDLCASGGDRESSRRLVDCPSLSVALDVIRSARERATGVECSSRTQQQREEDRAHFFLRAVVHQSRRGDRPGEGVSGSLVVCDLGRYLPSTVSSAPSHSSFVVGAASTTGPDFGRLAETDRIHRRVLALHLQTLTKVLGQLRELSAAAESFSVLDDRQPLQITAARDSKLTAELAPILQGNTHTSVLMFLVDHEDHFTATKRTLTSLAGVPEISCAVYSNTRVRLRDLGIEEHQPPRSSRDHADPLLDDASIDLERLAYGDQAESDWRSHLTGLLGEFRDAMTEVRSHSAARTSQLEAAIDPPVAPSVASSLEALPQTDEAIAPALSAAEDAEDKGPMQLARKALLLESRQLREEIDGLRTALLEAQDEIAEVRIECDVRVHGYEVSPCPTVCCCFLPIV